MFWYPYIKDGRAGRANYSFGSRNARSAFCEKCASAYRLLDLSHGASREEVKLKKWAFAELFSADRLRTMSEQARQLAEEQHKSINAACDQILRCPDCTRLRDDLNGSESRPAPYQPMSEMTAQEESKPQPDKNSLAEQVLVILKETKNKINTITFVREQTGWGLKEAEDFVDSIAPEWRPAPEQAAGATTAQEESKPQPDKYSLAEQVLAILKETNNKINAITFVREQTGWGLKEGEDFVVSIAPEWRPAPEQAADAATKQEESKPQPDKYSLAEQVLAILKETYNKINAITFVREQAAGTTAKQEAFGETRPSKFSARTVILVMVLVVCALVGWSLYSKHKAQMEAEERQHLYEQQHQQEERQRARVKEEQQRKQEEACAEKSAARRQNRAIGGEPNQ